MKKSVRYILLLFYLFSCNKQFDEKSSNNFYILGKGTAIADSTKVFLKIQESKNIISLDTSYSINNTFEFNGNINKPGVYGIYIDSLKGFVSLFMHNDSVYIELNENKLSDSRIKGSELNDTYLRFLENSNKITSKTNYLFPLFQKARTENDAEKLNEINKKIEAIQSENVNFILQFAKENPNSYISAFALQTILKNKNVSKDTIASIYNNFTHEVKKGDFAIEILLFLENQQKLENMEN